MEIKGDPVIIGGYESGLDSALHLARYGKKPVVLDGHEPWNIISEDPSVAISPHTKDRMRKLSPGTIVLKGNNRARTVEKINNGYRVITQKEIIETQVKPILATGFRTSLVMIKELIERDELGHLKLTDNDESTITPGLFLSGPFVWHNDMVHCFIYKFRTRFPIIADEIAKRLGKK
jgi:putative flavoprotein involved in K+ transport